MTCPWWAETFTKSPNSKSAEGDEVFKSCWKQEQEQQQIQNKRKIKEVTDPLFGTDGEMLMDNRKNPELLRFYFCIRFPH